MFNDAKFEEYTNIGMDEYVKNHIEFSSWWKQDKGDILLHLGIKHFTCLGCKK
jgi:hypothetical protein